MIDKKHDWYSREKLKTEMDPIWGLKATLHYKAYSSICSSLKSDQLKETRTFNKTIMSKFMISISLLSMKRKFRLHRVIIPPAGFGFTFQFGLIWVLPVLCFDVRLHGSNACDVRLHLKMRIQHVTTTLNTG